MPPPQRGGRLTSHAQRGRARGPERSGPERPRAGGTAAPPGERVRRESSTDPLMNDGPSERATASGGAPPVVVVVVIHDPGEWLEEALASLGNQDYPNLSVLVI